MKAFIFVFLIINSISSFAQSTKMELAMEKAALKTDLYFCFKSALGNKITSDQFIDSIIIKDCNQQLNNAKDLGIDDKEIKELALLVIEENQKTELEKAFEEYSRKNYNL